MGESEVIQVVVVSGEISFNVVDAQDYMSNPAVKLALAKSIAKQVQCPHSWVVVTLEVEQRRLRRLQAGATIDVFYNITIPAEDDSVESLQAAEERASLLISELLYIEQDKNNFKSVVNVELQAVNVHGISEVMSVSVPEMTAVHQTPDVGLCAQQSLLLSLLVLLTFMW